MAGNKRKIQEINAGSMADISFLLLIFFLVATTMSTDYGIPRVLPPWQEKEEQKPMDVKERNIFLVFVSKFNTIMAGGQEIDISQLKDMAKEFVLNPTNSPTRPEIVMTDVELIGNVPVSQGIVSLQNDRGTSYEMYIKVQNELTRAFNEIREETSIKYFQKPMDKLTKQQRAAVALAVPLKISEAVPRKTF